MDLHRPNASRRAHPRGRLSYANVTATLALVLAMSGGALAAGHYLINSTRQINPAVLKKLHGAKGGRGSVGSIGPIGPQGPTGEAGPKGARGPTGLDGFSALSPLPTGATENGDFAVGAPTAAGAEIVTGSATFSIPLAAAIPADHVVLVTTPAKSATGCAGVGQSGRGYLCIYTTAATDVEEPQVSNPEVEPPAKGTSGRFGFTLTWKVKEAAKPQAVGSYSVTGP